MPTSRLLAACPRSAAPGTLCLLVLACSAFGQDASSDQHLRVLIAQLRDPKPAAQKQAEDELVKLGPAAVPLLRAEQRTAADSSKAKLAAIIHKIEVDQGQAIASGKALVVSIAATGKPAAEVF